jgi:hypothetical protein
MSGRPQKKPSAKEWKLQNQAHCIKQPTRQICELSSGHERVAFISTFDQVKSIAGADGPDYI